jgi:hypothetical protein
MEDSFEFEAPEDKSKILIKKIIKRTILVILALSFIFVGVKKCFSDKNENGLIPIAKNSIENIKVKHDIENDLNVKNLDIEVYDNISQSEEKKYNNIIIQQPEKRDGFFARMKSEKADLKKEKMIQEQAKLESKEEELNKLEKEVGNEKLIKNIEQGKDIKPAIKAQLSASSSRSNAEQYWNGLTKKYPDIFKDLQHFIEVGNFGDRGEIYRLQVGYFSDIAEAKSFCNKFILYSKKSATDCIVVKN